MPVRVRYAPSPTGSPHVGNLRTAIYDWLLARKEGGQFIARLEDTDRDPARYKPEYIQHIEQSLRFLGIEPDEWWVTGGPGAPYVQSERLTRYQEVAGLLIERGSAYRCFCTEERLKEMREQQQAQGSPGGYDRRCRGLPPEVSQRNLEQAMPFVIRLAMPREGKATLRDAVYGDVEFDYEGQDDPVLLKSSGWPTYHLAAMVDDHDTGITHVVRGEDWLSSSPKHLFLFTAMGWDPPVFAHVPLLIGADKKKLSKRHGATQFTDFIEQGYLPEAMFNFLALLGWSPGEASREIFSREEIVQRFSLDGISNHAAVFDYDKLRWMNGEYIRASSAERLVELTIPYLAASGLIADPPSHAERELVMRVIPLVTERMKLLSDVSGATEFFFRDPAEPDEKGRRKWLTGGRARDILTQAARWFEMAREDLTEEAAELAVQNIATTLGIERGPVIHTVRIAATGRTVGPGLFETLSVLGKQRILSRLKRANTWVIEE